MSVPLLIPRVLGDDEDFPILPNDIDTQILQQKFWVDKSYIPAKKGEQMSNEEYWNIKLNEGATIVLEAFQKQGNWRPCDPYELVRCHEESSVSLTHFCRGNHQFKNFVMVDENRIFRVTDAFVIYCFMAAGKIRKKKRALPTTTPAIES